MKEENTRRQASNYIDVMNRLIPEYEKQKTLICQLIPFDLNANIKVLDLGAGPGVLSELVLQMYFRAKIHIFDLDEEMLQVCERQLSPFRERFTLAQGDFTQDDFGKGYDVILAGFTLHHLIDEQRKRMFRRLHNSLNDGGIFIAREVVVDEDPFITDWHYSLWRNHMKLLGEDDQFWYEEHRQKDYPVSIFNQIKWLSEAGFTHAACHWQFWNFAIISGCK